MVLDDKLPQISTEVDGRDCSKGEAQRASRRGKEASSAKHGDERSGASGLMERVLERENLLAALKKVKRNKGSGGVDGMTVMEMHGFLVDEWPRIREQILAGTYQPSPVRRVDIPKPDGGTRQLGIPTVVDRFIQQALLQVLQPIFDPTFSTSSYGYRPGRSAQQAILAAKQYVQEGRRVVVDVDLEKFFDRVNHDVLMGRLAKRIDDKRVLRLIRCFLEVGIMFNGVVFDRDEGAPQGGPLSPLLANFLLDEVDKELEKNGHKFVRYADDCTVYVQSQRAGERVLGHLRRIFGRLRLRINEEKTAVADASTRKLLGYSFWYTKRGRVKLRVADKAIAKFKDTVREKTRRTRGVSLKYVVDDLRSYIIGWRNYFRMEETPDDFARLDVWVRARVRAVKLKQWKRGRTAYRGALRLGAHTFPAKVLASMVRRPWRGALKKAGGVLTNSLLEEMGLPSLSK